MFVFVKKETWKAFIKRNQQIRCSRGNSNKQNLGKYERRQDDIFKNKRGNQESRLGGEIQNSRGVSRRYTELLPGPTWNYI